MSDLITEAQGYRDAPLRAVAVLNFADPAGGDNAAAAEALSGNGVIDYLDTPIGRRKAFPNAASLGRGVCELKRPDPRASAEMACLTRAVFNNIEAISKR